MEGGGSGFGAAIAIRYAQEGAKVIIGDINVDGGEKVASNNPSSISFQKMDVTSPEDWKAILDLATSKYGKVDILVNNAGTTYKNKPSDEVTLSEFERVFNVNVKSIFLASQSFIPLLIKQGHGGSMINISSTGAQRPRPGLVWYNASKGAVSNATKGLASEYGKYQVRVNNVCPLLSGTGLFEMFTGIPDTPENRQKFIDNVPLGRFINGGDFVVDGGKCI
ncbi:2,5-dichloro-2,5-cyclohexadiene-1,4-diol dehydrogenase [Arthroderma uncinatum]|uniref:2,5-dichloro-2,5-cyclohexadiene-1,4-diol dehydrogenase n=1 Tax=Arthroderma uncinatum TaxID=74035 RepID=UPI00144A6B15|nr:2,5-dichloro-2,5-cyclohexadiene-1,4-diol dehydrogenase [Arthroderma uncinatum]KAF3479402.1 2,5-dichloro-2,5-cyclohexadiene-1,4-diol dehydrogenase [Arthroderma uncinatum]